VSNDDQQFLIQRATLSLKYSGISISQESPSLKGHTMQHVHWSTWISWFLIGLAIVSLVLIRHWWRTRHHAGHSGTSDSALLDAHIATQWTEGRVRLGSLLTLLKDLRGSLEQDVETLGRLDHTGGAYEHEAQRMVEPNLRRFTFDKHLRDECRALIPFLQFCGEDLMDSQGWNTTEQLQALKGIHAAMGFVHSH
jgi:hypothetical protein